MPDIRVIICDDHAVVRRGLQQILSEEADISVLDEAANAEELLQQLLQDDYDVVVLDIGMPGRSGLDVLGELKQQRRNLAVLVLSMYPEDQLAIRALKAGAAGYMTKECAPEELVQAIRKIHGGGRYVSPTLAEILALEVGSDSQPLPHKALSDREYEVLCLIASGKTVSGIAQQLLLSVKTVSTYRRRVLEKMKMDTNAQLTHYAIRHGLVD